MADRMKEMPTYVLVLKLMLRNHRHFLGCRNWSPLKVEVRWASGGPVAVVVVSPVLLQSLFLNL